MSGKKAFGALAVAALIVLGAASAAMAGHERGDHPDSRGAVRPCSLDGVNPVYHPEIFGNAAAAASYGFVQGQDRVWRVKANCRPY